MNSKKMEIGSNDLISSLPDDLIGHILSFLSTKDAALSSVLSKRWRNLLAFVPNLDLETPLYYNPRTGKPRMKLMRRSFKVFVDRVMALQGNAWVKKFSLRCKICRDPSIVNGWILNVLERSVVDLYLYIASGYNYPLPPKVLMSKTLVRLKLAGTDEFTIDVGEVFLPRLKTLYLDAISFNDESGAAFTKLISACHALEELIMVKMIWGSRGLRYVSNPNLKRVTFSCEDIDEIPKSVSFNTPNLVYLEYTDLVAVKYPKANFDSLVEARIGLRMTYAQLFDARDLLGGYLSNEEDMVGNATHFLMGISNVKILYLSANTLEVLTFYCKAIPIFKNLIQLTIQTDQKVGWESMPSLLENSPNLETLIFEGLHYKDTNQCEKEGFRFKDANVCYVNNGDRCVCKPWEGTPICLSSSPVKILKVFKFGDVSRYNDDMDKQMDLIKYFLETMPNLEQVILYYHTPFDDDVYMISTTLQMLEEVASPKCKIQIISHNISLSFIVGSSSSTNELVFLKIMFPV